MRWKVIYEPYPFDDSVKRATISAVAFGLFVFIFLRFFQPFGLSNWQSNSKTIQLFGYGLVTTFCLFSNFLVFKTLLPNWYSKKTWTVGKNIVYTLWMFFTIGFGNLLYSTYRNFIEFSLDGFWFYQGLTLTVGVFPVIVSTLLVYNRRLSAMQKTAAGLNTSIHKHADSTQLVTIPSQNKSENIQLNSNNILAIKAIENYVEVYHDSENRVKKEVIRNTLKNMEEAFLEFNSVQKCHRSYLVNLEKVHKFKGNAQGLTLSFEIQNTLEVPVSRAFVNKIRLSLESL
jgi:hypothetical protein